MINSLSLPLSLSLWLLFHVSMVWIVILSASSPSIFLMMFLLHLSQDTWLDCMGLHERETEKKRWSYISFGFRFLFYLFLPFDFLFPLIPLVFLYFTTAIVSLFLKSLSSVTSTELWRQVKSRVTRWSWLWWVMRRLSKSCFIIRNKAIQRVNLFFKTLNNFKVSFTKRQALLYHTFISLWSISLCQLHQS